MASELHPSCQIKYSFSSYIMKCIVFCVFFLVMTLRGVVSQVTLVESGPGTTKPGESTRLTCTVTGISLTTSGYCWHWIRQPPGKGLEWLARICYEGSTNYAPTLQSRITITKDNGKIQFYLQMSSLTAADSATYFCARYRAGYFDYWGKGTFVTVTTVIQSGPSLFPLIPSSASPSNGLITIGCMAKDVPPALIRFTWEDHNNINISESHIKQYPTISTSAGAFTASSQVAVSADDWQKRQPFYCKAESVDGVARVIGQASSVPYPKMSIHAPRLTDFADASVNATISCTALHLHTASTTIQWFKDGKILDSGFTTNGPATVGCGYSIYSELSVSKKDWNSDKEFSCRVHNEKFSAIKNISYASTCESDCREVKVHVETIPPFFYDIYLTKSANLTCRISNVPDPEDFRGLQVTWTKASDKKQLETVIGQAKRQENSDMFFVDATATICKEEWDSGERFECKVTLPLLPTAETRTLTKLQDVPLVAPSVYVLPPASEQVALREIVTITCLVKKFSPPDFFVTWLQNDKPIEPSEYFTSKPIQESKTSDRYFAYSMLNVNEEEWSNGTTYTCLVGHEALPFQTTQKTVDKMTGKPTQVHLSLVLSDVASTCQ